MGATIDELLARPTTLTIVLLILVLVLATVLWVRRDGPRPAARWFAVAAGLALVVTLGVQALPSGPDDLVEPIRLEDQRPDAGRPADVPARVDGVVTVTAGEWDLAASTLEVRPGTITFELHNAGAVPHALRLRSDDDGPRREWRSDPVETGGRITLTADLPAGTYELDCPIESEHGEHDALGMEVRFVVHDAAPLADVSVSATDADDAPPTDAPQDTSAVDVAGFGYTPTHIRVPRGTAVTWHNTDREPHTATGDGWGTDLLAEGESGSIRFTDVGTHPYTCALHPGMTGTVAVVDATSRS